MRQEGKDRVSLCEFFLRLAVGLWLIDIACQILNWMTE